MKDSGPATTTLLLPTTIDASRVRQFLMPVEDWGVVVMDNGEVYSWGRNAPSFVRASERYITELELARQQGKQAEVLRLSSVYEAFRAKVNDPVQVTCLSEYNVVRITCTWDKAIALTDQGHVYLLKNFEGWAQAHLQNFSLKYPAADIASGKFHFLVLLQNGRVCSWERGLAMGHGESALSIPSPKIIKAFRRHKIVQIAAGSVHSLFLTSEGLLFSCGLNFFGQLCLPGRSGDHKGIPTLVNTKLLYLENERRKIQEGIISPAAGWRDGVDLEEFAKNVKVKAIATQPDRSLVCFEDGNVFETLGPQVPALL